MLYSTNTITSKEELNKFNNALLFSPKYILLIVALEASLFTSYFMLKERFFLIYALIFPFILYGAIRFTINNKYKKEAKFLGVESIINFYEDSIEQINQYASTKIPYKDLYKLIETKTNYYFLTGTNTGFNIIKANCSPELIDYIENNLKNIINH